MKTDEMNYYSLTQLAPMLKINYRNLIPKVKRISEKYRDKKDLINRKSGKWHIHSSIIIEFKKNNNLIDYKYFITAASENQLDIKYWIFCINDLNQKLKSKEALSRIKYVIETTKNNINHIHFITSFSDLTTLNKIIKNNNANNYFAYGNS